MTGPDVQYTVIADDKSLREQAVAAIRQLDACGMNCGSAGNLSLRWSEGVLITPPAWGAADQRPRDMVWLGHDDTLHREWQPSSEWHFHRAIYQAWADLHALVHTHGANATALAYLRKPLPALRYMVAVTGGHSVPCVPYSTFGRTALSRDVAAAFADRKACLMANHGLVAGGVRFAEAMKIAQEIESLCEVYLKSLAVGEPAILTASQMAEMVVKFETYGKRASA